MNDGTRYLGDIDEAAQEPDGPKLHGVTQPICVASPASDVDQLGSPNVKNRSSWSGLGSPW